MNVFSERESDKPRKIKVNQKSSNWYCCNSTDENSKCVTFWHIKLSYDQFIPFLFMLKIIVHSQMRN